MKIAIIPARGGSKRIKDKNIRDFCGKPLLYYSLTAAKSSGLFDQIHVSTDSERIAEVASQLGFPVDFLRAPELADDHTGLNPVMQWVLKTYLDRGRSFEDVCLLMPTAPLLTGGDLKAGYELYLKSERKKKLLAVSNYPVPIEWAFTREEANGSLTPCQPGMFAKRSQDLQKKYFDAGLYIFFNSSHLLGKESASDSGFVSCVVPKHKVVDIDDEEDFQLAEILYLGQKAPASSAQ